jgi:hypothetical protein
MLYSMLAAKRRASNSTDDAGDALGDLLISGTGKGQL